MISPPFQGYCYKVPSTAPEPAKNLGNQCTVLGNPVNVASGNKIAVEIDYPARYSSSLKFVRTYNSGLWVDWLAPPPGHNRASRLGPNWRSNFDAWIVLSGGGRFTTAYVNRPDGRTLYFKLVEGEFRAEADIADRLERLTDGGGQLVGWLYTVARTDEVETYDSSGRLISITDRAGKELSLQYDANDRLASVTDDFGKSLTLAYDASNRLATLTDPAGSTYSYTYNADGNVLSVTRPASNALTYVYGEQANPYALTGIVDENNVRFATYRYNVDGRVSSTEHAGGVEKYSFSYAKAAGAYTNTSTTVVDPLFQSRAYTFATIQGVSRAVEMSQPCSSGCMGSGAATLTYDANANVASRGDFKGNKICHAHDLARNLETVLLEGVAAAASCPADLVSYTPALGTNERKIITTWHPTYRLPTQVDEPGRRTTFTHDAHGNALTKTILDTATSESRVWTYTYNSLGQVLTVDGPRLASDAVDRTTYTYYTCVTGNKCGQVHTVTNALGQTTTYLTYNAHGQPLTITDPNGVQTTLVYDLRRRLTSRTVGTEQIGLEYWPTGLLKKVTLPDSSFALYTYDDAHRLTRIDDAEGNHVVYTLDSMSNRTAEEFFDSLNAPTESRSREFNSLNQLWKEIGSAGTAAVTTEFAYDDNGNQTEIDAPLSRSTIQAYDELNRLKEVTDALSGVTTYGYNALDQLTSVIDPRALTTTYSYNALDDLLQQVSPDTGTTTFTYDPAGNVKTRTDARGASIGRAIYGYDALNRVDSIEYPDRTVSYSYDACAHGIGRLCSMSDADSTTSYEYDALGRLTSKSQSISLDPSWPGPHVRSVQYEYQNGHMTRLVMPGGIAINYLYDSVGRVSDMTITWEDASTTPLLSDVLYDPAGRVRGWTWPNGTHEIREYDQDGRVTDIESAGGSHYSYDDANRITQINSLSGNPAPSWEYDYDELDRLTDASRSGLTQSYTYDANGNRQAKGGTQSSTYNYTSPFNSNRLQSVAGALARAYQYDAMGNVISDGVKSFTYDGAGRMSSVGNGATTFRYNGKGERVLKQPWGQLYMSYLYDEAGHVLEKCDMWVPGECNIYFSQQYIWLGDIPVAALIPHVTYSWEGYVDSLNVFLYSIHTDHLNTPRRLTWIAASAPASPAWQWDSDPFGVGTPNGNPDSDPFLRPHELDLRFPGQIFDAETGLNYNYKRDYDPQVGRYVESDPIGLAGGINTYSYARSNPIAFIDSDGQQAWVPAIPRPFFPPSTAPRPWVGPFDPVWMVPDVPGDMAGDTDTTEDPEMTNCPRDCRGLLKQLRAHEEKLRQYRINPDLHDNLGFLKFATPGIRKRIIDGRIRNLERQIENFRRQYEACLSANGGIA